MALREHKKRSRGSGSIAESVARKVKRTYSPKPAVRSAPPQRSVKKRSGGDGSVVESAVRKGKCTPPKPAVKSAPPQRSVKKKRVMDFSHVPCSDFILGVETESLGAIYHVGEVIGEGQFGIVSKVIHHETGATYACKSISKNTLFSQSDMNDVVREIHIIASLQGSPEIVSFESVHEDDNWIHIVMEMCSGGELFDAINTISHYPESLSARIFEQIVRGVLHCHERGILHHDLKPENILLAEPCHGLELPIVKIADFGLAVALSPGEKVRGVSGSPFYMAPEILDDTYGLSADIWSLGVILYILLSGSPPFFGDDDRSTYAAIKQNELKFDGERWAKVSQEAKSLIREILNSNPSKRPTASELLEHPWLLQHCSSPPSSPSEVFQSPGAVHSPENCQDSPLSSVFSFKTDKPIFSRLLTPTSFWSDSPLLENPPSPPASLAHSSISSVESSRALSTSSSLTLDDKNSSPNFEFPDFGSMNKESMRPTTYQASSMPLKIIKRKLPFDSSPSIPKKKRSERKYSSSPSSVLPYNRFLFFL